MCVCIATQSVSTIHHLEIAEIDFPLIRRAVTPIGARLLDLRRERRLRVPERHLSREDFGVLLTERLRGVERG
jgi:hypothetical protein